jgi:hypothetical protein
MRDLQMAARLAGIGVRDLARLQLAGQRFGVTADQMSQSVDAFRLSMIKMQNNVGGFRNELIRLGFGKYIGKALADAGKPMEQYLDFLEAADQLTRDYNGDTQRAAVLLGMVGINAKLAAVGGKQFREQLDKTEVPADDLKAAQDAANKFNDEIAKTQQLLFQWQLTINKDILPGLTNILKVFNAVLATGLRIAKFFERTSETPAGQGATYFAKQALMNMLPAPVRAFWQLWETQQGAER